MIKSKRKSGIFRSICVLLVFLLVQTSLEQVQAQDTPFLAVPHHYFLDLSTPYSLPVLRGMRVYPAKPFQFDFVVDSKDRQALTEKDTQVLIKYFLTCLTIPQEDLWVNLSPYEAGRIIPNELSLTAAGNTLLQQDRMLKELSSSLTYPESRLGKKFWDDVYQKAFERFGTTNLPMKTYNKVWIVPDKAVVYDMGDSALIGETHLKVMLEEDYLAMAKNRRQPGDMFKSELQGTCPQAGCQANQPLNVKATQVENLTQSITREIILPQLEKEINEGKNFAPVRQVFHSMILAAWFKRALYRDVLAHVYVDQKKIAGVDDISKKAKEEIYKQYLRMYKVGAYNYIREDVDPISQQVVPRKYFSGGFFGGNAKNWLFSLSDPDHKGLQLYNSARKANSALVRVLLNSIGVTLDQLSGDYANASAAMISRSRLLQMATLAVGTVSLLAAFSGSASAAPTHITTSQDGQYLHVVVGRGATISDILHSKHLNPLYGSQGAVNWTADLLKEKVADINIIQPGLTFDIPVDNPYQKNVRGPEARRTSPNERVVNKDEMSRPLSPPAQPLSAGSAPPPPKDVPQQTALGSRHQRKAPVSPAAAPTALAAAAPNAAAAVTGTGIGTRPQRATLVSQVTPAPAAPVVAAPVTPVAATVTGIGTRPQRPMFVAPTAAASAPPDKLLTIAGSVAKPVPQMQQPPPTEPAAVNITLAALTPQSSAPRNNIRLPTAAEALTFPGTTISHPHYTIKAPAGDVVFQASPQDYKLGAPLFEIDDHAKLEKYKAKQKAQQSLSAKAPSDLKGRPTISQKGSLLLPSAQLEAELDQLKAEMVVAKGFAPDDLTVVSSPKLTTTRPDQRLLEYYLHKTVEFDITIPATAMAHLSQSTLVVNHRPVERIRVAKPSLSTDKEQVTVHFVVDLSDPLAQDAVQDVQLIPLEQPAIDAKLAKIEGRAEASAKVDQVDLESITAQVPGWVYGYTVIPGQIVKPGTLAYFYNEDTEKQFNAIRNLIKLKQDQMDNPEATADTINMLRKEIGDLVGELMAKEDDFVKMRINTSHGGRIVKINDDRPNGFNANDEILQMTAGTAHIGSSAGTLTVDKNVKAKSNEGVLVKTQGGQLLAAKVISVHTIPNPTNNLNTTSDAVEIQVYDPTGVLNQEEGVTIVWPESPDDGNQILAIYDAQQQQNAAGGQKPGADEDVRRRIFGKETQVAEVKSFIKIANTTFLPSVPGPATGGGTTDYSRFAQGIEDFPLNTAGMARIKQGLAELQQQLHSAFDLNVILGISTGAGGTQFGGGASGSFGGVVGARILSGGLYGLAGNIIDNIWARGWDVISGKYGLEDDKLGLARDNAKVNVAQENAKTKKDGTNVAIKLWELNQNIVMSQRAGQLAAGGANTAAAQGGSAISPLGVINSQFSAADLKGKQLEWESSRDTQATRLKRYNGSGRGLQLPDVDFSNYTNMSGMLSRIESSIMTNNVDIKYAKGVVAMNGLAVRIEGLEGPKVDLGAENATSKLVNPIYDPSTRQAASVGRGTIFGGSLEIPIPGFDNSHKIKVQMAKLSQQEQQLLADQTTHDVRLQFEEARGVLLNAPAQLQNAMKLYNLALSGTNYVQGNTGRVPGYNIVGQASNLANAIANVNKVKAEYWQAVNTLIRLGGINSMEEWVSMAASGASGVSQGPRTVSNSISIPVVKSVVSNLPAPIKRANFLPAALTFRPQTTMPAVPAIIEWGPDADEIFARTSIVGPSGYTSSPPPNTGSNGGGGQGQPLDRLATSDANNLPLRQASSPAPQFSAELNSIVNKLVTDYSGPLQRKKWMDVLFTQYAGQANFYEAIDWTLKNTPFPDVVMGIYKSLGEGKDRDVRYPIETIRKTGESPKPNLILADLSFRSLEDIFTSYPGALSTLSPNDFTTSAQKVFMTFMLRAPHSLATETFLQSEVIKLEDLARMHEMLVSYIGTHDKDQDIQAFKDLKDIIHDSIMRREAVAHIEDVFRLGAYKDLNGYWVWPKDLRDAEKIRALEAQNLLFLNSSPQWRSMRGNIKEELFIKAQQETDILLAQAKGSVRGQADFFYPALVHPGPDQSLAYFLSLAQNGKGGQLEYVAQLITTQNFAEAARIAADGHVVDSVRAAAVDGLRSSDKGRLMGYKLYAQSEDEKLQKLFQVKPWMDLIKEDVSHLQDAVDPGYRYLRGTEEKMAKSTNDPFKKQWLLNQRLATFSQVELHGIDDQGRADLVATPRALDVIQSTLPHKWLSGWAGYSLQSDGVPDEIRDLRNEIATANNPSEVRQWITDQINKQQEAVQPKPGVVSFLRDVESHRDKIAADIKSNNQDFSSYPWLSVITPYLVYGVSVLGVIAALMFSSGKLSNFRSRRARRHETLEDALRRLASRIMIEDNINTNGNSDNTGLITAQNPEVDQKTATAFHTWRSRVVHWTTQNQLDADEVLRDFELIFNNVDSIRNFLIYQKSLVYRRRSDPLENHIFLMTQAYFNFLVLDTINTVRNRLRDIHFSDTDQDEQVDRLEQYINTFLGFMDERSEGYLDEGSEFLFGLEHLGIIDKVQGYKLSKWHWLENGIPGFLANRMRGILKYAYQERTSREDFIEKRLPRSLDMGEKISPGRYGTPREQQRIIHEAKILLGMVIAEGRSSYSPSTPGTGDTNSTRSVGTKILSIIAMVLSPGIMGALGLFIMIKLHTDISKLEALNEMASVINRLKEDLKKSFRPADLGYDHDQKIVALARKAKSRAVEKERQHKTLHALFLISDDPEDQEHNPNSQLERFKKDYTGPLVREDIPFEVMYSEYAGSGNAGLDAMRRIKNQIYQKYPHLRNAPIGLVFVNKKISQEPAFAVWAIETVYAEAQKNGASSRRVYFQNARDIRFGPTTKTAEKGATFTGSWVAGHGLDRFGWFDTTYSQTGDPTIVRFYEKLPFGQLAHPMAGDESVPDSARESMVKSGIRFDNENIRQFLVSNGSFSLDDKATEIWLKIADRLHAEGLNAQTLLHMTGDIWIPIDKIIEYSGLEYAEKWHQIGNYIHRRTFWPDMRKYIRETGKSRGDMEKILRRIYEIIDGVLAEYNYDLPLNIYPPSADIEKFIHVPDDNPEPAIREFAKELMGTGGMSLLPGGLEVSNVVSLRADESSTRTGSEPVQSPKAGSGQADNAMNVRRGGIDLNFQPQFIQRGSGVGFPTKAFGNEMIGMPGEFKGFNFNIVRFTPHLTVNGAFQMMFNSR